MADSYDKNEETMHKAVDNGWHHEAIARALIAIKAILEKVYGRPEDSE